MDITSSEWNDDEEIVVRMWVGYMGRVQGVWCSHGYKTINMALAFITAISHVYVSNSKLNIIIPCFVNFCVELFICLKFRGQVVRGDIQIKLG